MNIKENIVVCNVFLILLIPIAIVLKKRIDQRHEKINFLFYGYIYKLKLIIKPV